MWTACLTVGGNGIHHSCGGASMCPGPGWLGSRTFTSLPHVRPHLTCGEGLSCPASLSALLPFPCPSLAGATHLSWGHGDHYLSCLFRSPHPRYITGLTARRCFNRTSGSLHLLCSLFQNVLTFLDHLLTITSA